MKRSLIMRLAGHPVFILLIRLPLFGFLAVLPISNLIESGRLVAVGDPVQIADWNIDRILGSSVAEEQVGVALNDSDVSIAEGIVALASEHNIFIHPALIAKVREVSADQNSVATSVTQIGSGFLTGKSTGTSSFVGAMTSDYFFYGDLRDFGRESIGCLSGGRCDPRVLGLAGAGIVLTAITYVSDGLTAPERSGLSIIKIAERDGRLSPGLVKRIRGVVLNPSDLGALVDIGESLASIAEHGGIDAAYESLNLIEGPEDAAQIARLALAKGKQTRAILRLLGRKAYHFDIDSNDIAKWFVWTTVGLLGFALSCRTLVRCWKATEALLPIVTKLD